MSYSPELQCWKNIIDRCSNPKSKDYKNYGGRGITICEEWRESFKAFTEHVGTKPSPEYSIDRINNDGNYEPGNVRWATRSQQQINQRHSPHRLELGRRVGTLMAQKLTPEQRTESARRAALARWAK